MIDEKPDLKNFQLLPFTPENSVMKGVPIFYTQASQLPSDMPDWLKQVIRKSDKPHVWLSCNGTSFEDILHMGEIEYLPGPGFPVQYFPYDGHPDYLSPMVALKFSRPAVCYFCTI
ncbi:unnamed protein product [Trichogramma brassicae]|uniref:Uncharacterized protein n=1 Tax=Trichogramma brassicae TaxID=86971 RepID=A0A6H5I9S8_9HYME|nr:unnamed protein product [Trichogramma brassicae]